MSHAHHLNLHGVFLQVFGKGVLLTGDPGIGKSLCALALLHRSHALIADDLVLIKKENQRLIGQAPITGFGLLHVRSIGLIDVEMMFGAAQVLKQGPLDLIIHLTDDFTEASDPLFNKLNVKIILEIPIPMQILSIRNSQDMAILIETAVRLAFGPKSERVKNFETYNC